MLGAQLPFFNALLGRGLGVSQHTVRRYLDLLAGTYVVRTLQPWHENLAKRQVKSPKVYVVDSGLLHSLLSLHTLEDVLRHPKVGASWEGFAIEQIVARLGARDRECHFWATHQGAELDLLVVRGLRRRGFEVKRADSPRLTPSMRIAMEDLRLDSLDVVYPGRGVYALAERVRAVGIEDIWKAIKPL